MTQDAQALAWLPAPDPGIRLKPSLRAAASSFAKVVVFLAFVLLVPVLVGILTGNGLAFLGGILLAQFGLLASLPALVGLLLPAVRLMATTYELDDAGVRVHSSIVARSDQRVSWDKVTLLEQHRGLIDRALGIEALHVVAYGAKGTTLHLVGLKDAAPLRDLAARRMRDSASVDALFAND